MNQEKGEGSINGRSTEAKSSVSIMYLHLFCEVQGLEVEGYSRDPGFTKSKTGFDCSREAGHGIAV